MKTKRLGLVGVVLVIFFVMAGCGGGGGGDGSVGGGTPLSMTLTEKSAQERGNQTTNLIAEIVRSAKGSLLIEGQLRPGAYPSSRIFTSEKSKTKEAVTPGCPTIIEPDIFTPPGFAIILDYGAGCIDAFDGVTRSGKISIDVTNLTIDPDTGDVLTANVAISFTNFVLGEDKIEGSANIDVTSPTSESWDLNLTGSNPDETKTLTFQGTVIFSDASDIETLNGSGAFTSSVGGQLKFTFTDLQFDFDNEVTPLICDDPIGGSLTFTGINSAVLTFGLPDPGCGFAFLSVDGGAKTQISLDGAPHPIADLSLSMVNPNTIPVGQPVTYTITVVNHGPDAAHNIVVTAEPSGVGLTSMSPMQGSCEVTDRFTCTVGTMNPQDSIILVLVVTPAVAGTLTNTAGVTSSANDPDPSDNSVIADSNVAVSGFTLSITPAGATVAHGDTAFYTITAISTGSFIGSVSLECVAPLPTDTLCSFFPASMSLPPNGIATASLTIGTAIDTPVGDHIISVRGTSGTLTGLTTAGLTVQHGSVAALTVSPSIAIIHKETSQQFTASAMDNGGHPLTDVSFVWASSNSGVATVSSTGLATEVAPGGTTITATASGTTISGFASLTVAISTLTIIKVGTGSGTVTSSPAGFDCGTTCLASFADGTQVTLTATPAVGSTFAGWSGGGCAGTGTCTVTTNAAKSVAAIFNGVGVISIVNVPANQSTIQGAIDAAVAGDMVLVAPGTYRENINFHGKAITVMSAEGPGATIIDGNQAGSVVTFASGEGQTSVLSGFTLQNGRASFGGGGVGIGGSAPKVIGNMIANNSACDGAGIEIRFGSPLIQGNIIANNVQNGCSGGIGGGGISIGGAASAQILDNIISNNSMSSADGGGISLFAAGTPTIRGNVISGNRATGLSPCAQGGGIWMVNFSDALIVQNVITNNSAGCGGGIYWLVPSGARGPLLVNNTITGNDATLLGSGILADGFDAQTQLINNNIISKAGQTAIFCGDFNDLNLPIFKFNNVFSPQGAAYGGICTNQAGINGNISADPLFVNPSTGNYRLQAGSASIDAGDSTAPELPVTDFARNPRILDGNSDGTAVIDIGAYEFNPGP